IPRSFSISFSVLSEKGALPSKACSTMPSSRSPSVRSFSSASPLRTFSRRFSMRTPVCTRSTTMGCSSCSFMVLMYQCTKIMSNLMDRPQPAKSKPPALPNILNVTNRDLCVRSQQVSDEYHRPDGHPICTVKSAEVPPDLLPVRLAGHTRSGESQSWLTQLLIPAPRTNSAWKLVPPTASTPRRTTRSSRPPPSCMLTPMAASTAAPACRFARPTPSSPTKRSRRTRLSLSRRTPRITHKPLDHSHAAWVLMDSGQSAPLAICFRDSPRGTAAKLCLYLLHGRSTHAATCCVCACEPGLANVHV